VLRFVIRNGFSKDLAGLLLHDIRGQVKALASHPRPVDGHTPLVPPETRHSFAH
jgi:hypothetical protein